MMEEQEEEEEEETEGAKLAGGSRWRGVCSVGQCETNVSG